MSRTASIRAALVTVATGVLLAGGLAPVGGVGASSAGVPSSGVQECLDDSSAAKVKAGSKANEPAQDSSAEAYGQIPTHPLMAAGSVTVPVAFNLISDHDLTRAERTRWTKLVDAQVAVLNAGFSGSTENPDAADTPFRFALQSLRFHNRPEWYHVVPGKAERDMKSELYSGDSETLNLYAADIGGGLLGWAYFPQGYNNGRDYIDGVVFLDESMPGGTAAPYNAGDTLTHEVGHWLALHHTFQGGCSASGDFVEDTPKEAYLAWECDEDRDTCAAPGTDPVHNFMDYTDDECIDHFTPGQAQRMNDAWIEFREVG